MNTVIQYIIYIAVLILLAVPLGKYIGKVMEGKKVFLTRAVAPLEKGVYKLLRIRTGDEMTWKTYAAHVLIFSGLMFAVLFTLLMAQGVLPMNPEHIGGMSWHLAFNTTASFLTNTNWQAYSGEAQLSYLSQMLGLTVQNFTSAAIGISVLFALLRGFSRVRTQGIGNFWVDFTRSVLYVLLPLSIIVSVLLVSQGVVQSIGSYETGQLLQPVTTQEGEVITQQVIPMGPAASQIAIKQLGTNGGGFFGVNSAHPFENPTVFSNMVEMLSILLIPVSLCFSFGAFIKNRKQGRAIFAAMLAVMLLAITCVAVSEQYTMVQTGEGAEVQYSIEKRAEGNMEGKESRFGVPTSVTWAVFTTAASNGAVNSMHDSYTPIGGMVLMLLMMLGEVVFGGVGCGLYGMLGFAVLTVFMAGLMVGRTPEYLEKKIEPFEMKMAALICFATPAAILAGSGIAALVPAVADSLGNPGAHGFSELLYSFASAGGNNGSAFAGFNANTVFLNMAIGLCMLFVRFVPMIAVLAMAGSLAGKKKVAAGAGTLSTTGVMFVCLLVFVVLLVGALSFFPALSLGPIAEHLQSLG